MGFQVGAGSSSRGCCWVKEISGLDPTGLAPRLFLPSFLPKFLPVHVFSVKLVVLNWGNSAPAEDIVWLSPLWWGCYWHPVGETSDAGRSPQHRNASSKQVPQLRNLLLAALHVLCPQPGPCGDKGMAFLSTGLPGRVPGALFCSCEMCSLLFCPCPRGCCELAMSSKAGAVGWLDEFQHHPQMFSRAMCSGLDCPVFCH